MTVYLKKYPLTLSIISVICYLSFFKPPQTDMEQISGIDKLVHLCMYGGVCTILWIEYLRTHQSINKKKILIGAVVLPIALSGIIELLQSYLTEHRGGEWSDFIANSIGVLLSTLSGYYILRPIIWKPKRNAGNSHEQPTQ